MKVKRAFFLFCFAIQLLQVYFFFLAIARLRHKITEGRRFIELDFHCFLLSILIFTVVWECRMWQQAWNKCISIKRQVMQLHYVELIILYCTFLYFSRWHSIMILLIFHLQACSTVLNWWSLFTVESLRSSMKDFCACANDRLNYRCLSFLPQSFFS